MLQQFSLKFFFVREILTGVVVPVGTFSAFDHVSTEVFWHIAMAIETETLQLLARIRTPTYVRSVGKLVKCSAIKHLDK